LDRFGLCVSVEGLKDPADRVAILENRAAYESDPLSFARKFAEKSAEMAGGIERARALLPKVVAERPLLYKVANLCLELGVDGHRGDLVVLKSAKTIAAWEGRESVSARDVEAAAELALPHRVRRQPLMEIADNLAAVKKLGQKPSSPVSSL
jgi:magnesium chelatase subunit I